MANQAESIVRVHLLTSTPLAKSCAKNRIMPTLRARFRLCRLVARFLSAFLTQRCARLSLWGRCEGLSGCAEARKNKGT